MGARATKQTFTAKALGYARAVVAGKIPAGALVRRACRRHLDDLEAAKKASFPYKYDPKKADRACLFIELMPHIKGEWAAHAELIRLEPWQCFIVCSIFGWVRKSDGNRRFLEAYLEVPRKNAKSTLAAAIGLYMFVADGEHGAEVYSGATSEDQAYEIFRPAREMTKASAAFREQYAVTAMTSNLSVPSKNAKFEPVIGKPGDGASPSCALIDEFHEHQTPDLYQTMKTGMGARRQPLCLIVTTAGTDLGSPCYDMHIAVEQMLSGAMPNERQFAIVYSIDEGDDWTSVEALKKANPNFGVSVFEDYLLVQLEDARRQASKVNAYKTKHLNIWCSAQSAWLQPENWLKCAVPGLSVESLMPLPVFAGIDLASKSDIACLALVGKQVVESKIVRDETIGAERPVEVCRWKSIVRSYLPEGAIARAEKNRAAYEKWRLTGHLIVTDGDELDFDVIRQDVLGLVRAGLQIEEIAYDSWRATQLAQQLREDGAECVEIPQVVKYLSPPMREMEAAVLAGRWEHPGDPCFDWQIANVVCREDTNQNIKPNKQRPDNKIDAAVATLMALSRGLVHVTKPRSIYADRSALGLAPRPEDAPAIATPTGRKTSIYADRAALGLR